MSKNKRASSTDSVAARDVPSNAKIHERGNTQLDTVLDFVTFAARTTALPALLDEAPKRLASLVGAEVCSLYLLEGDGETLVMRGNVGFTERALGQVRLKVGEGITGTVLQVGRPISVVMAAKHDHYRAFAELDEERFPVFAAVPIIGRKGAVGATVVQRKGREPFSEAQLELLVALSATIAAGVRAAELVDTARDKHPVRRAGGGTRKVTLPGRPVVAGRVVGPVAAVKRPPPRPREERRHDDEARLRATFESTDKTLRALQKRARNEQIDASFLSTYVDIVNDGRLRGETLRLCREGMGIAEALGQVTRMVARAAATERSTFLDDRARDIEDLCNAMLMMASSDPRAELPTKAVLMADELSVFDVLMAGRFRPVGIALSTTLATPRTRALAALMGVPTLEDVGGLFRWASDGDIALLDADHGLFVLNPSRAEVAALRQETRDRARG